MDFVITADGSKTLFNETIGEHYHSKHGALQESRHVFLKMGLIYYLEQQRLIGKTPKEAAILEVGFGTGLNFLLSADYALQHGIDLIYTGVEAYPLSLETIKKTDYGQAVQSEVWDSFIRCYQESLTKQCNLLSSLSLLIAHQKVMDFYSDRQVDIVYFDAFAAVHQPEMWTRETLAHLCQHLKPGGVFVTYAITGDLKRIMKSLGFQIEKAPGAPGKREMLRAVKM